MVRTLVASAIALAAFAAQAAVKTQVVEYTVGQTVCKGYLAYDDAAKEARPGVLVVHEWWGLNDYAKRRTEQLAELGYVAFAADIYGGGKVATDAQEAGKLAGEFRKDPALLVARTAGALDTLKKQRGVDASRTGAIGYCFGGTTVLALALSGAEVQAVVSFHGSLPVDAAADKPVKANVLVCNGADDPMVKPEDRQKFKDVLTRAKADWEFIDYSGAVHAFTNPEAGKGGMPGVAYNEKADKRSWELMKDFFAEAFKKPS
jgi:dienelactone hydrolase